MIISAYNIIYLILLSLFVQLIESAPDPLDELTVNVNIGESSCYADDTTPYRRFGSRTSYLINANLDDSEVSVPGCRPIMLWLNARQGTKGPSHDEIIGRDGRAGMNETLPPIRLGIIQAFADGKSKLCEKDVNNLENWKFIYTAEEDKLVGDAGRKEMRELGQRLRKRFPGLLKDSRKTVRKTSPEQGTSDSMKAFLMGLYGHPVDYENSTEAMFTFDKDCPAYMHEYHDGHYYDEYKKIREIPEYKKMVAEISNRIGVQLNKDQMWMAYTVCRYEIANYPDALSPWCALFSDSELQLIEYAEDLYYYYLDGYGNDISRQMTQPLVADLHQHFSSLKYGNEMTSAFLYIVHSRQANTMLHALGLYRDDAPPRASDWPTPHNTLWTTSTMLSYGHNLALVALQCDAPQDQFKVLAMHQERRISLSGICGEDICPLQSFLDNIKSIVDIDFDKVCKYQNDSSLNTGGIAGNVHILDPTFK